MAIECNDVDKYKQLMSRSVAMGWHGMANSTPGWQDDSLLPRLGICLQFYIVVLSLQLVLAPVIPSTSNYNYLYVSYSNDMAIYSNKPMKTPTNE